MKEKIYRYFVSFWYIDGLGQARFGNSVYNRPEPMDASTIDYIEADIKQRNPTWMHLAILNYVQM